MVKDLTLSVNHKKVFPARWFGLAFMLCWIWLVLFGCEGFSAKDGILFFACGVSISLFIMCFLKRPFANAILKTMTILSCFCLTISTFVICSISMWGFFEYNVLVFSSFMFISGASVALMLKSWVDLYKVLKTDTMTITVFFSVFLSAVLYYAMWLVRPDFWGIFWIALPLVSLGALRASAPRDFYSEKENMSGDSHRMEKASRLKANRLAIRLVFLFMTFVLCGFIYGVLLFEDPMNLQFAPTGVGLASGAAIIMLWLIFSRKTGSMIIQGSTLIFAVGFMITYVVRGELSAPFLSLLVGSMLALSFFMAIVLCVDVSVTFKEHRINLYGKTFFVSAFGMVLGSCCSYAAEMQSFAPLAIIVIGFVSLVALAMVAIMSTGNSSWIAYELSDDEYDESIPVIIEDIKRGFLEIFSDDMRDEAADLSSINTDIQNMDGRIALIVSDYDLSPRQAEVLVYLARGYKADFIANKLFLSPNTVRTHIANIYNKLSIHTQQDLLDFFYGE